MTDCMGTPGFIGKMKDNAIFTFKKRFFFFFFFFFYIKRIMFEELCS